MTWIGNAAAEKRWRRDGPRRYRPLRFLHVSWGQLSRATHLRLSNHTRQRPQLWHASDNTRCPNYPATRQASPRERETRPYPLDIQASISPSLSLSPFSFCEAEVSSKSVFLFINSSSFFSRRRSTLMHRERFTLIPFSHSFLYFFFERIYIYIGEGDRVNERLRVMKMSVRGDVERAAWKE